jgi:cysteinyl-tRNA synthetase
MTAPLKLYNTLTRTKEVFRPLQPEAVRMYVCGPTVYDFAHIGNARAAIVFDVLFRLLRQAYGETAVVYTRNVTDVDDKINARAQRDFPNLPLNAAIAHVTEGTLRQYREDVAAVGCLPPTHEPRATAHLDEMRALIERLVARGVAYVAEDHVLFSPSAMDVLPGAPRYGALARRSLDEMLAGARVEVAPYKRDPMDFVLWKPSKPSEPGWPSPSGIAAAGRPGWHIECSAMSMATLLQPFGGGLACDDPDKNMFDIHGGGIDLVFPHHENEIAQSCCAFGSARMANVWMHNGFLQVEGEKMSKSLGNFFTIHELLRTDWFGGRKWSGETLRLAMLRTHYRQPIDWTVGGLEEAEGTLARWYDAVGDVEPGAQIAEGVSDALADDLNTPAALMELHRLAHPALAGVATAGLSEAGQSSAPAALKASANLLGLLTQTRSQRLAAALNESPVDMNLVASILAERAAARANKEWQRSDRLRDRLAELGVAVKDSKDGTTWELRR